MSQFDPSDQLRLQRMAGTVDVPTVASEITQPEDVDPFDPKSIRFVASMRRDEDPSFWDAVVAGMALNPTVRASNSLSDSLADVFAGWMGEPEQSKEPFDLRAELQRLPQPMLEVAGRLADEGYLAEGMSRKNFYDAMNDAMGVEEDLNTLTTYAERNPWYKTMGASMIAGATDPVYMIPVGGQAARGAMGLKGGIQFLAAQGVKGSASIAATSLAGKKITDVFSYNITNQDGIQDEVVVTALGGGLGFAMPFAGYAAKQLAASVVTGLGGRAPAGASAWAKSWNSGSRLKQFMNALPDAEIPSVRGVAAGEGRDAAKAVVGQAAWRQEQRNSRNHLAKVLRDARRGVFHDGLVLSLLRENNGKDGLRTALLELRRLYRNERKKLEAAWAAHAAGTGPRPTMAPDSFRLIATEHPGQQAFDSLVRLERVLTKVVEIVDKKPGMKVGTLVRLLADLGDKLPTGTNPNARARQLGNWFHDLNRALSASAMELTDAQMAGRAPVRSSAEAVRDGLDGVLRTKLNQITGILKKYKMHSWWSGATREGRDVMMEAADILMDRRLIDEGMGHLVKVNAPRPAAVEIADVMDSYFSRMYDELVGAGLLSADPLMRGKHYLSLVIDPEQVRANRPAFVKAAIEQFRINDERLLPGQVRVDAVAAAWDGASNNPNVRSQIENAVRNYVGDPTLTFKNGAEVREAIEKASVGNLLPAPADLGPNGRVAYQASLDAIHQRGADDLAGKMADPWSETELFSQLQAADNPSVMRERTFVVVGPALRQFAVRDPVQLMRRYRAQIHGQIGVARAIESHPEIFGSAKIKRGSQYRSVKTAGELLEFLGELRNDVQRATDAVVAAKPDDAATFRSVQSMIAGSDTSGGWVLDAESTVKRLISQVLYDKNNGLAPSEAMMFTSRMMSTDAVLTNGGMMGYSNLADSTAKLMWTVVHPRVGLRLLTEALLYPYRRGNLSRETIEFLNMGAQVTRLLRDDRFADMERRGFGSSPTTRRITTRADIGRERIGGAFGDLIGLNAVNNFNGRWGAMIAIHEMVLGAKKLARGEALTPFQMGRLNRMGVTKANAQAVLEQIHANGAYADGAPTRATSFADFLSEKRPVNPLFDRWTGELDTRRILSDNLGNESRRFWNVTPGVGDRPLWEDTNTMLRLVNQFSAFVSAYNTQRMRPLAQAGGVMIGGYVAAQFLTGWLMRSTALDLTNRRSFSESIANLLDRPDEEIIGAAQQSMVLGNVTRFLGYMDNLNIGPSSWFNIRYPGGTFGSVARSASDRQMSVPERIASFAGAGPQNWMRRAELMYTDDPERRAYMAAQGMWGQNLIWSRVLNRTTGLPAEVGEVVGEYSPVPLPGTPSEIFRPAVRPTMRTNQRMVEARRSLK